MSKWLINTKNWLAATVMLLLSALILFMPFGKADTTWQVESSYKRQIVKAPPKETPEEIALRDSFNKALQQIADSKMSIFAKAELTKQTGEAFEKSLKAIQESLLTVQGKKSEDSVKEVVASQAEIQKLQSTLNDLLTSMKNKDGSEADKVKRIEAAVEKAKELQKKAKYAGYALMTLSVVGSSVGAVLTVIGVTAPAGLAVIVASLTAAINLIGTLAITQKCVADLKKMIEKDKNTVTNPAYQQRINEAIKQINFVITQLDDITRTINAAREGLDAAKKKIDETKKKVSEVFNDMGVKIEGAVSKFVGLFCEEQRKITEKIRAEALKKFGVTMTVVKAQMKFKQLLKKSKPTSEAQGAGL